jgi:plastocyanin
MKIILKISLVVALLGTFLYAKDYVVDQKGKTFIPHALTVKVGDTITFTNSDPFAHNAYTDNEANEFDIGMQTAGGRTTIDIKAAESFDVECAIHPNMLLEVTAK